MEKQKLDILNTATGLFTKLGLRSVSIDDVCKKIHISKKTFYQYFKQKEQLIEEVLNNIHSNKKIFDCWAEDKDKNIIELLMESDQSIRNSSAEKEKKNFTFYYDLEKYYPKIFHKQIDLGKKQSMEMMSKIINRGINENLFRHDIDIDLASEYISLQFQTMMEIKRNQKKMTHQQMFDFLRDIVIRILANENGMKFYTEKYNNNKK